MFAAEKEVRRWREEVERRSSLSPRQIDELEDHLRARVELEMELEPALGPARALAIARGELGRAVDLSREFATVGKPTWRRWMVAGLSMFGVSFMLPATDQFLGLGLRPDDWMPGWQAFLWALDHGGNAIELLSPLSSGLVPAVLLVLRLRRSSSVRWPAWLMMGATALNVYWAIVLAVSGLNPLIELGMGYWFWVASFGCLASALWLRDREWTSAKVKGVIA